MSQGYVGIDLHRRRSVIVHIDQDGEVVSETRIENDPIALSLAIADAGPNPDVALEATYGWYWAADVLEANGATVHLAHPLGVKAFSYQRVKKDVSDAKALADLPRLKRLPEAWLPDPEARELRELVRYRARLVALRSGLKAQVHAVLAKEGVRVPMTDLFGRAGSHLLDDLELGRAYALRVRSLRELIAAYDHEVSILNREITLRLRADRGYQAINEIPGGGKVLAAVFVAEIGDVKRFHGPRHLCSWAGVTPKHRESDRSVHRGHITKQGSRPVRWAAVEAVAKVRPPTKQWRDYLVSPNGED
jgi:transposase